ncbi:RHS repeat-associated core domain-containing protein [Pseudomonas carassii]|uniref:RHS repeat-associated core domain-containing protein n=1 Tax=Pseudomonas carassii TaxID=3115855 RepID=A0ABU7HCM3_9PSED|nr:RHS repeat-associated core domain-containing protein [Pseudomonas sp. 137P]MEE1889074.1 RHS repeat-associated core domain-containing protein [Pseudomonas sp. 137P]
MRSVSSQSPRSTGCALLMSDAHQSVLQVPTFGSGRAYCVYGYHRPYDQPSLLLAFNGECAESQTGSYLLGNGNRTYNPVLMRFHSIDPYSPFEQGGLNTYAYCLGDPINNFDPTGNWPWSRKSSSKSDSPFAGDVLRNTLESSLLSEMVALNDALGGGVSDESKKLSYGVSEWRPAEVKEVRSKKDLDEADLTRHSSWVLMGGRIFMGTYTVPGPKLTHAALAKHAAKLYSVEPHVVAAGEIKIKKGKVYFDDWSGHYLPPRDRVGLVRKIFKSMDINAQFMRIREE